MGGGGRAPPRLPGGGGGGVEARGGRGTEAEVEVGQTFAEDFLERNSGFLLSGGPGGARFDPVSARSL